MRTLFRNAPVIDGTGAGPREHCTIFVEDGKMIHVGPLARGDEPAGDDVTRVDVAGRTVVSGLIEAHIHLSYNDVKAIADLDLNCPPEYSTLVSARTAERLLHCGDGGSRDDCGRAGCGSCSGPAGHQGRRRRRQVLRRRRCTVAAHPAIGS